MLPRLSYSHISHITPYMTIKQSYSSNKNCSNNYSLNPFKCNFGFPGSKSLCSYSDIFSTFFVFIKCTLICQQDLKYLIQCCDPDSNIKYNSTLFRSFFHENIVIFMKRIASRKLFSSLPHS